MKPFLRQRLKKLFFIGAFILGIILFNYYKLGTYFSLETIQNHNIFLKKTVRDYFHATMLIYALVYIFAAVLSLPAAALSMVGGFLFNLPTAVTIIVVSATIGACITFFAVRYLLGNTFQKKYARQLKNFNREINDNGAFYLLGLRLSLIVPFFLVNILAGLTEIRFSIFITTTILGILPASTVFAYAGKRLQEVKSIKDIFSLSMLMAFLLLTILAVIPVMMKRRKRKKDERD